MPTPPRLAELAERIAHLNQTAGRHPAWLPGLALSRTPAVTEPLTDITRPMLAMIAQGAKRAVLADRVYDYRAGQFLIATVDLPLTAQVTQASEAEPFLGLGLPLKPDLIAELLLETGTAGPDDGPGTGIVANIAACSARRPARTPPASSSPAPAPATPRPGD